MATPDPGDELDAAYVEGTLGPQAEAAFEDAWPATPALSTLVAACRTPQPLASAALLREQLLDLTHAPRLPIDVGATAWEEGPPGLRFHLVHADVERGVRGYLVLAQPGAKTVTHRHLGDEVILVLDGELRDERGVYRTGEICHSREGSVHAEEVPQGAGPCLAYAVYYGELEPIE